MIVGIDIGASTTKAVVLDKLRFAGFASTQTIDASSSASIVLKKALSIAGISLGDVNGVAISGGGSRLLGDTLSGTSVRRVDEIKAIGLGGLLLSGKKQALVVSMGTGTAMVVAYGDSGKIKHIGGTGVGGGTVLGLSKLMLGIDDFKTLEEMAVRGNPNNVDLTVADIVGGPIGIIPAEATASNFGKLDSHANGDDVAAAIFNMVSQVIGMITVMAAKAYSLERDVVLVSRLIQSKIVADSIRNVTKLFQIETTIPEKGEYCIAIGAARSIS